MLQKCHTDGVQTMFEHHTVLFEWLQPGGENSLARIVQLYNATFFSNSLIKCWKCLEFFCTHTHYFVSVLALVKTLTHKKCVCLLNECIVLRFELCSLPLTQLTQSLRLWCYSFPFGFFVHCFFVLFHYLISGEHILSNRIQSISAEF